ncbi:MAG: ribosomal RNA small subunit methyltransferase A [Chloroflexi bacterium]|nr:ribosomal RNA small subunit methyltransferase A [Chloroflexota bacterium]
MRPSRGLGQNFLRDEKTLQQIVRFAGISSGDAVLEVGPGLGSLTRYLALAARTVTAVELDRGLFPALEATLAPYHNVRLVEGDILELIPASLVDGAAYLVVANIPYYITSAILRHLLESEPRPRRITLTVQAEVADRICAVPGDLSLLALGVQVYGKPEALMHIPAGSFFPPPKVDSALVGIEIHPQPLILASQMKAFFHLARAGFGQKRKTLRNSLSTAMPRPVVESALAAAGIDPQRRAETLSIDEWRNVTDAFSTASRG